MISFTVFCRFWLKSWAKFACWKCYVLHSLNHITFHWKLATEKPLLCDHVFITLCQGENDIHFVCKATPFKVYHSQAYISVCSSYITHYVIPYLPVNSKVIMCWEIDINPHDIQKRDKYEKTIIRKISPMDSQRFLLTHGDLSRSISVFLHGKTYPE